MNSLIDIAYAVFWIIAISLFLTFIHMTPARSDTYAEYTLIDQRSAGQLAGSSQWAWTPTGSNSSSIQWGSPSSWPPAYHEDFLWDGEWVYQTGWTGYKINTIQEFIGDGACNNLRTIPSHNGYQHYAQWWVQREPYCLKTVAALTQLSTNRVVVHYTHLQIWSQPIPCAAGWCITQYERWWDDNQTPMQLKLSRTNVMAKGIGMASELHQYFPLTWNATMNAHWRY